MLKLSGMFTQVSVVVISQGLKIVIADKTFKNHLKPRKNSPTITLIIPSYNASVSFRYERNFIYTLCYRHRFRLR